MIALFNSADWDSISIDFDDGGGVQTFTPAGTSDDAYSLAQELVVWLNITYAGDSWSWTWSTDATTGGALLTFTGDNSYDIVANATAQSLLGMSASYVGVETFNGVASGTMAPTGKFAIAGWRVTMAGGGIASGAGALRDRTPGDGLVEPAVACSCSAIEAARLTSELQSATNPRQGYVYDLGAEVWRLISVGRVDTSRRKLIFMVRIEAFG